MTPLRIRHARSLLAVGIVLIALNLRPTLAGVGPLLGDVRASTGLSNAALGFLTTLPLLAFGVVSALTPRITGRLGINTTIAVALSLIAAGAVIRAAVPVALLFAGTLALGTGIALGNVLMPVLVKREFPRRLSAMTSLYSSAMGLGATVAAGVSVPVARAVGWRIALAVWAVPAILALIVWAVRSTPFDAARPATADSARPRRKVHRSRLAWYIAAYMGIQSLTFYVILAWLPELLQSRGRDADTAGWMLALSQATGIIGSAAVPLLAGRLENQRVVVCVLGTLEAVALCGLSFRRFAEFDMLWVALLGLVLGGTFGLALLFLVLRAADSETATSLSAMAQSAGYLIAASGPTLFGFLLDATRGWSVPLALLAVALVTKVVVGIPAAARGHVHAAG